MESAEGAQAQHDFGELGLQIDDVLSDCEYMDGCPDQVGALQIYVCVRFCPGVNVSTALCADLQPHRS